MLPFPARWRIIGTENDYGKWESLFLSGQIIQLLTLTTSMTSADGSDSIRVGELALPII